jgi:nucleotide-binding universal stress UspA family protein
MARPIVADALKLAAQVDPSVPVRGALLVTEPDADEQTVEFAVTEAERHHVPVHVAVTSSAHRGPLAVTVADLCTSTDLLVLGHHRHGRQPHHLGHDAVVALHIAPGPVAVVPEPSRAQAPGTKVPVAAESGMLG